jgi:hypothetical protein
MSNREKEGRPCDHRGTYTIVLERVPLPSYGSTQLSYCYYCEQFYRITHISTNPRPYSQAVYRACNTLELRRAKYLKIRREWEVKKISLGYEIGGW